MKVYISEGIPSIDVFGVDRGKAQRVKFIITAQIKSKGIKVPFKKYSIFIEGNERNVFKEFIERIKCTE